MWAVEEDQRSSAPPNMEKARSDLEGFTPESTAQARAQPSENSSVVNVHKASATTPGVMQSGDGALYRNGKCVLQAEKAFSIQIGWRLFKLSGASIMSDGAPASTAAWVTSLTSLERHHISRHISKNRYDEKMLEKGH